MRSHIAYIPARLSARFRSVVMHWWGGIGCRVAFLMSLAICLVVVLLGAFLLWEGRRHQHAELQNRVTFIGNYFSSLAIDDILTGDRERLYRKLSPAFLSRGNVSTDLAYLMVYDRAGRLLVANTTREVIRSHSGSEASPRERLDASLLGAAEPRFRRVGDGLFELVIPAMSGDAVAGYVRVGISDQRYEQQVNEVSKKAIIVVVPILIIGLLFSQIITAGIVRPVAQLGSAVDELSRQNWKSPIQVRGTDEISRLANAFNQMAMKLKQREESLSQGNRDLFILHSAGLDLMESLDVQELLRRVSVRAEDLIRADTVSVAAVDRTSRQLRYLGIEGSRARQLSARELPLEAGGIYNWMASYGTPLLIQDAQDDLRLDSGEMKTFGVRSLLSVPLWSSNVMIGILTAVNKRGGEVLDRHDLRLFTVYSSIAGAALQNAFLYSDLKNKMDELRNTQQQLVHSTKMAAIGELAANVAHEINNPLTSVLGYTSHLLRTLDLPEESRQKLRLMEQETLRVRKIIRNLLDFSRQRMSWIQQGDVLQPLRETVALLQGAAERSSVRIVEDYPDAPVVVRMDHNEMKQVFLNIMNNALHAMSQGGTLRVSLLPAHQGEIAVVFEDSGHGIPKENLRKIFEPFFSTKNYGDGTGLGLSISERIIQGHGGRIEVESSVGTGSAFRVTLPAAGRA